MISFRQSSWCPLYQLSNFPSSQYSLFSFFFPTADSLNPLLLVRARGGVSPPPCWFRWCFPSYPPRPLGSLSDLCRRLPSIFPQIINSLVRSLGLFVSRPDFPCQVSLTALHFPSLSSFLLPTVFTRPLPLLFSMWPYLTADTQEQTVGCSFLCPLPGICFPRGRRFFVLHTNIWVNPFFLRQYIRCVLFV